jgi:exopolyphosphatase/guanosine-5'-triphosphate,3'-diphosphate pyrophosphatase
MPTDSSSGRRHEGRLSDPVCRGVTRVFEALSLPVPSLARASYTLDAVHRRVRRAWRSDSRGEGAQAAHRYTVGGCMAELSDVVADGKPTRTIAVESEDAAGVMRAVRELGLGGYVNTSYPKGPGGPDRRRARALRRDRRRHQFHQVPYSHIEHDAGGKWRTVVDRAEVTRLGEGLGHQG